MSNVVRIIGKVARIALLVIGWALGLTSWLLLGYAVITLGSEPMNRLGAMIYGGALILQVIGVAWGVAGHRAPLSRLASALGIAGWICAVATLLFLNIFPAVL